MKFLRRGKAAIVVPVHNRLAHTKNLLDELRRSEHPDGVVLIVVDDGSTDGTADYLETQEDITVVRADGELWWSGAANAGCTAAAERDADTVVLLNNDNLRISKNCVSELARCARDRDACVASVGLRGETERLLHAGGRVDWPSRGLELRHVGALYVCEDRVERCDWLPGMSLAFPLRVFTAVGGFDAAAFPQYYGDADFTLRARRLGADCLISYACSISNDERSSGVNFYSRLSPRAFIGGLFSRRSSYQVRTTVRFAARHCPPHLVPAYLAIFYARYAYATVKTWVPGSSA
jgi:N-acetylglucosaminyl-diphospho-decaprenol L-rhamnosyltransferase